MATAEAASGCAIALIPGARAGERVYVQSTLQLSQWSAPEPDIVVTRGGRDRWTVPRAGDILLIIEVADTTLDHDLGTKVPLYQRHGIPEVWVVDREGCTCSASRTQHPATVRPRSSGRLGGSHRVAPRWSPLRCFP